MDPSGAQGPDEERAGRTRERMRELLARLRSQVRPGAGSEAGRGAARRPLGPPGSGGAASRAFHLAVDEAGEVLVATGDHLVIGHSQSRGVDLPFLADVAPRHARLDCRESFHGGWEWALTPLTDERVELDGRPVGADGAALTDGARARLASNLRLRFLVPDPASKAAVLELGGGDCHGAQRVLLLGEGPSARARISGRRGAQIPVPGLAHEIAFFVDGGELVVRCDAGVRVWGSSPPATDVPGPRELRLPFPLRERCDLGLCAPRPAGRPPFGITVRPLASAPGGASGRSHRAPGGTS